MRLLAAQHLRHNPILVPPSESCRPVPPAIAPQRHEASVRTECPPFLSGADRHATMYAQFPTADQHVDGCKSTLSPLPTTICFQVLRRYDRTRPRRRRVRVVARQPLVTSGKAGFAELRLDEPGASPPDVGLFATVGILGRLVLAAGAGARAQAIQSGGPKVRTISQCGARQRGIGLCCRIGVVSKLPSVPVRISVLSIAQLVYTRARHRSVGTAT